MPDLGPSTLTV